MADYEQVLALFAPVEDAAQIDALAANTADKPLIVLSHRKEREYKTKPFLNYLAFLFRERTDLVRESLSSLNNLGRYMYHLNISLTLPLFWKC
jgi:hypothetical protein